MGFQVLPLKSKLGSLAQIADLDRPESVCGANASVQDNKAASWRNFIVAWSMSRSSVQWNIFLRLVAIQALLSKQGSEKIMMLLQNTGEEHGPVHTHISYHCSSPV